MTKAKSLQTQVGGNHYKDMVIQPIEFTMKNKLGFLEGNIIKYVARHLAKNGRQDLEKAKHYIELALDHYYPEKPKPVREKFAKRATVVKKKSNHPMFKLWHVSHDLKPVVGFANQLTRSDAVKKVWAYIKLYNLQDPKNKRTIIADEKLERVFGKKQVTMFEIAKILGTHLT